MTAEQRKQKRVENEMTRQKEKESQKKQQEAMFKRNKTEEDQWVINYCETPPIFEKTFEKIQPVPA